MDTLRKNIPVFTLIFVLVTSYIIYRENATTEISKTESKVEPTITHTDTLTNLVQSVNEFAHKESKASTPGPLSKIIKGSSVSHGVISSDGIIAIVNKERASAHDEPLNNSTLLESSATVKAKDILARSYFAHTAPDGKTVSDLVSDEEYEYIKVGENLALGSFFDDADVMKAWMASPGHRANILDHAYEEIGVGIAYGKFNGEDVVIVVQHFGRPKSACPTIDTNLKLSFETAKNHLDEEEHILQDLKDSIDKGRASGNTMNDEVEKFNSLYSIYKIDYEKINELRSMYNEQVFAFNKCLEE